MSQGLDLAIVAVRFASFGLAIAALGAAAFDTYAPGGPRAAAAVRAMSALLALSVLGYLTLLGREAADVSWPSPNDVAAIATSTRFGQALVVVLLAATVQAAMGMSPGFRWVRLALAGAAIAPFAFVGHGADAAGLAGGVLLGLLAAHLLAIGVWLGALPWLLLAVMRRQPDRLALLERFGLVGGVCVLVVLGTGVGVLVFMMIAAGGNLGPGYVATLLAKLAFVFGLLCLAAINRFWLTPLLRRHPERARQALTRSIVTEQLVAVAALGFVALLGQLDPTM